MKSEASKKDKITTSILPGLFDYEISKSQRRKIDIVEAAITNFATIGYENTTFEKIAKTCKVSRPLILHYFEDQESILELAVKYIRANMQQIAIEAIEKADTPQKKLAAYVESTFEWVNRHDSHVRVWLFFFYQTSIHSKFRKINSEMVNIGHDRITALLEMGKSQGIFKIREIRTAAKILQNIITGALVSVMTEDQTIPLKTLKEETVKLCLKAAGFQT